MSSKETRVFPTEEGVSSWKKAGFLPAPRLFVLYTENSDICYLTAMILTGQTAEALRGFKNLGSLPHGLNGYPACDV
ncbi:hypothetical protein [Desulfonema magnum]|uniref:hypothetical protein n=1 Tax=Desulfonema magnum TaxID=45655 RepID=UPI001A9B5165|nr:hypothetical protein [Desulfonema magnum]